MNMNSHKEPPYIFDFVLPTRLELVTPALKVPCSTNWATEVYWPAITVCPERWTRLSSTNSFARKRWRWIFDGGVYLDAGTKKGNLQMNEGHAHGKTAWCRIRDLNSYADGSGTWIRRVCQFHQSCIFLISSQLILQLSSHSRRLAQCCHTLFGCGGFCLLAQPFFGVAQFLLFCFRAQICICTTLRLIWSHHASTFIPPYQSHVLLNAVYPQL